jgi:hypothetical protein
MNSTSGPSLRSLIRRLFFAFFLTLLGSWGLLVSRLSLFRDLPFFYDDFHLFYLDLGSLAAVFLGLLLCFYYRHRLGPRLRRIEEMGETNW